MAWPTFRESVFQEMDALARGTPLNLTRRKTLPELRCVQVAELHGVGPRIALALKELGVVSLADLVSHYPSRHEDLSNVKKISDLRVGERATVVGRVVGTKRLGRPVRGMAPGLSVQLYDGTGYIPATVWGRGWLLNQLVPDTWVVVAGEVQRKYGLQLTTKSIEVIDDPATVGDSAHAGRFVPVYPVSKGINARRMRTLVHRALEACGRILDPLPAV